MASERQLTTGGTSSKVQSMSNPSKRPLGAKPIGSSQRGEAAGLLVLNGRLPPGYIDITEREAEGVLLQRGTFLRMLVLRKIGEMSMARTLDTTYELTRESMESEAANFQVKLPPHAEEYVRTETLRFYLTLGSYFVILINEWLGLQPGEGLPFKNEKAARKTKAQK